MAGLIDPRTLARLESSRGLRFFRDLVPASLRRRLGARFIAYEPEVVRALERLVAPGSSCADVGANTGALTAVLLRCAGPSGTVTSFEPHPDNLAALQKRFGGRVTIVGAAVTDGETDRVRLYAGRGESPAEWTIRPPGTAQDTDGPALDVPALSLDAYYAPGTRLDVVKIDVEGAEGAVLAGMRRLLREQRPALVIEFHDERGWAGRRELLEAGYVLRDPAGETIDPAGPRAYHVVATHSSRGAR